jgi:hypothetical protein
LAEITPLHNVLPLGFLIVIVEENQMAHHLVT